jgi:hypothetical protein
MHGGGTGGKPPDDSVGELMGLNRYYILQTVPEITEQSSLCVVGELNRGSIIKKSK